MKIQFYTPEFGVCDHSFGCATFGFVGGEDPNAKATVTLPHDLQGDLICGSYAQCLASIPDKAYQVCIVLFGNTGGENAFLHSLQERLCVPLVGGGAAIHPETGKKALLTGQNQAALLLICDDRFRFEVCCENIHREILSEHKISYSEPRVLDRIDGVDAVTWLSERKVKMGLSPDDFEHLTLSDPAGINAHLSLVDGKICSGRDLQSRMQLRYVPQERVYERMQAFYDDPHGLIFGCAGLKGLLPKALDTKGMGLFLFGEVCTNDSVSEFGNLMLSKLRILPK